MKYTILVTGPSYGTQNASTAFLFCKSLIKTHHKLNSVFFYCDGVLNANNINQVAVDEYNLTLGWQLLSNRNNIKLFVCASSASRRGVIEDEILSNKIIKKGNLAPLFQFTGLIDLAIEINKSDRIIQF